MPATAHAARRGSVLALALLLVLTAGCSLVSSDVHERESVGTLVASWSEEDDEAVADVDLDRTLLVEDVADRDDLLDRVPPALDTSTVARVDLDRSVLVVARYSRCMQSDRVVVDDDGVLEWQLVHPDGLVLCEWSPRVVQVWEVHRDDVGGTGPVRLGPDREVVSVDRGYRLCDAAEGCADR